MMMAAQVEIVVNGEIIDSLSHHSSAGDSSTTILLCEDSREYDVVKNCFLSGMGLHAAAETTIVSVRKTSTQRITTKAKLAASNVFTEAVKRKNGGDANVRYGWYSGSKEEIERIVSYGFSSREIEKFDKDDRSHGVGIHFLHHTCSLAAAVLGEVDEEGIQHLLLCRLILGKPERIVSGSKQSHPSSSEYDCGVDNLENPRKYVIWSCNMNSYILPSHVVSFKSPRLRGLGRGVGGGLGRARSPCVSFPVLMSVLSKSLDHPRMNVILTSYDDFLKRKVRREQLIRKMREVVGDELLFDIIKKHRNSETGGLSNRN